MFEIKKFNEDHWKDYKNLRLEALKAEPLAFGKSYSEEEREITEQGWRERINNMFFATLDDNLVGMAALVFGNSIKISHIANIYSVFVLKEYRGQGAGTSLLDFTLNQAQKNGAITKVKLSVNTEQSAAIKLYQHCGFEIVGRLKQELQVDGKYYDEFVMEKYLTRNNG